MTAHPVSRLMILVLGFAASIGGTPRSGAGEPVRIATALSNPRQPQVAVGEDGAIHVAFGIEDSIYCATSTDGGNSYSAAVLVGRGPRLALGMRRGPRIAVGRKTIVVAAVSHGEGSVLAWRSSDSGHTWDGPVRVNDNSPGTANEGLHALAAAPDGGLYCAWLDHRINHENQIFGAASTDGGQTWSENRLIYRSPGGSVCPCCHPAVTFDRQGTLYVMWRNSLEGFRDMYAAVSRDGGRTFDEARKLGTGGWKLDSCPMDGGYLAATKPGQVTTVWRRKDQIYRTDFSRPGEQRLGSGEQPWVAGTPAGAWIVWLSQRGGDLWLAPPESRQPVKLAGGATDPAVAAAPNGSAVVVWETGRKGDGAVMAAVVTRSTERTSID